MKKTDPYMVNFGKNVTSGGVAGAMSLMFVYSLDYCRTRLANDAKAGKKVLHLPSLSDSLVIIPVGTSV